MLNRGPVLAVGLGALSLLGLAACGSSPQSGGNPPTTVNNTPTTAQSAPPTAASTTTTANSSQNLEADKAAAQMASLKLSDFPTNWTSQSRSNSATPQTVDSQFADCVGVSPTSLADAPASYSSPSFQSPTNLDKAASSTHYWATTNEAKQSFDVWSNSKFPECMAKASDRFLEHQIKHPSSPDDTLPEGTTIGKTTISPLSMPQFGDRTIAYQAKITVTVAGHSETLYEDDIVTLKGRALAETIFNGTGSPFASSDGGGQHYAGLVADRLTNPQGGPGAGGSATTNPGPNREAIKAAIGASVPGCWSPTPSGGNIWGASQQEYFTAGKTLNEDRTNCAFDTTEPGTDTSSQANLQTYPSQSAAAKGASEIVHDRQFFRDVYQGGVYVLTVTQDSTATFAQVVQRAAESNAMRRVQ